MKKNFVQVKFDGTERFYGYYSYDESIAVGDKVLVDANGKLTIVIVMDVKSIDDLNGNERMICKQYDLKHILCKLDFTAYEAGMEYERKVKDIQNKLRERYEKVEEMAKYKLMAESDEEMKSLIAELEAL